MKLLTSPLKLSAALCLAVLTTPTFAADLAPSHTALPAETIAIVHVPNGNEFLNTLRKNTKLGAVGLSEERIAKAMALVRDSSEGEWEQLVKDMGKYNLKPEDWNEVLAGDAGFGLVMLPQDGAATPLSVGLTWVEPGGDLAERVVKAIEQAVEENKDKPHPVKRLDTELSGFKVMHLIVPEVVTDFHPVIPDNYYEMTPEEQENFTKEQDEKRRNAPKIVVDQTHLLIVRDGRRLLIGNTFPQSQEQVREKLAAGDAKVDFAAITRIEEAKGVFARFLMAHKTKDPRNAFDVLQTTPGLATSLPSGLVLMDVFFDPRPVFQWLQKSGKDPKAAKALQTFGVTHLGPIAMRSSFENNKLLNSVFASAPAPRPGLVALLDQPPLPAEPPAWVPSAAIGYTHVSFDLGKAYTLIKTLSIQEFGQEASQGFDQIEQSVGQQLGTDMASLLSAFGQQHSLVSYLPELQAAEAGGGGANAEPKPADLNKMAFVWTTQNDDIWNRVFALIGQFAPMMGDAVAPAEEQGFTGYRATDPNGNFEGGLFKGKGFLALSIGRGVVETTLNTLGAPPEGEAAMRGAAYFRRAKELLPLKPGLWLQINDMNRYSKVLRELFIGEMTREFERQTGMPDLDSGNNAASRESKKALFEGFKALIPSDVELDGMTGVSVTQSLVGDHGLVIQSAMELPPVK
ncbi:MAG: hypothetical protein IT444_04715 [Phycisphaeraceae bacterium]|nr:hypothetical protein [Phycisphaeraceae bacterium]